MEKNMEKAWKDTIYRQRSELARSLHAPLAQLAGQCSTAWGERPQINEVLLGNFDSIPYCTHLYALDAEGIQRSDNVGRGGVVPGYFGRDRSDRPYMREAVPPWGFLLSDAYISQIGRRPSLTALHRVASDADPVGYVGADFDLRDLPVTSEVYEEPRHWRQIKGDPAIRGTVFLQSREESPMDRDIDQALSILEELMTGRGVFQVVIHFSSSRATAWFVDDPYRYRIIDHEALADTDICLTCPQQTYPKLAAIPRNMIGPILQGMRELRLTDQTIYLRSASLNIINGMVSLTFSCDGSHYMSHEEFLNREGAFRHAIGV
jgi:hypothetical protein